MKFKKCIYTLYMKFRKYLSICIYTMYMRYIISVYMMYIWENFKSAYPKSDNFMPKSDTVKARMFKHNLKSKF